MVVKKNQHREQFSRDKMRLGIEHACWKRPISAEQIDRVVNLVEAEISETNEQEVPSEVLGEVVMRHLATLDKVAYIRFASVYRDFRDVADFVREVTPYL
jgi:transcriptional repressor NrdR